MIDNKKKKMNDENEAINHLIWMLFQHCYKYGGKEFVGRTNCDADANAVSFLASLGLVMILEGMWPSSNTLVFVITESGRELSNLYPMEITEES